jgi:hypothetical protein
MFIFVVPLNDTILYCTNVVSCYTSSIEFFKILLALKTWLQCINNLKGQRKPRRTFQKEKKGQSLRCSSIDYFQALVEKKKTVSLLMVYRLQTRGSRSS